MTLSTEFTLELKDIPASEAILACLLMSGVEMEYLDSWVRTLEQTYNKPPQSEFAKMIYNAAKGADAFEIIRYAKEEFSNQYPDLAEYLKGMYPEKNKEVSNGNSDDDLP